MCLVPSGAWLLGRPDQQPSFSEMLPGQRSHALHMTGLRCAQVAGERGSWVCRQGVNWWTE